MIKNLFFAVLMVVGLQSMAQYDPEAKALLDAMSNRYKDIPAFSADFEQALINESAGINETMSGAIQVKGDKYILDIAGQQIFNNGTDVWSYNEEMAEVTVSVYDASEQEISLNNIWDIYQKGFKYILLSKNDNGNNVVDLDPIDRNKSYFKIRMMIDQENQLKSFIVFEDGGNQYKYSIKNFDQRNDLSDASFTFDASKYPGVEVIDFR